MGLLCSLSLLLLAACHSDDNEPIPADGQSRTVTITLNLQDFQTRTISGTEDDAVTRLLMQVIDNGSKESLQRIPIESGTATTTIQLYPSHSYTFLFWADDESYTATDLTAITLGNGLSDTQAGIAYAACIAWDGTATINATLKHAVSKVTLKTTSRVWADNELTFTIPQTHSGYNVQASAPTGTAAPYEYSYITTSDIDATEDKPAELFSFYVLAPNAEQELTIGCNGESVTVPANLSGGKHIVLKGNIGRMTEEIPAQANIIVSTAEWEQEEVLVGVDKLTDATVASPSLEGKGTADEPFLIQSAADLKCYFEKADAYAQRDQYAQLGTDIEMNTSNWAQVIIFGIFDGNGHTISGTQQGSIDDGTNEYFALFGDVYGTVENLKVSADIIVTGQREAGHIRAGGIASGVQSGGTITQCTYSGNLTVSATLTGASIGTDIHIGGIAGNNFGTISGCTFSGTVDATEASAELMYVGSIVGRNRGTLSDDNKDTDGTVKQ